MKQSPFTSLSDDLVLQIFSNLSDDPRNWSRLACVSTKFSSLIRNFCWRSRCLSSLSPDLASGESSSLHKISVCCPGLFHSGVLLDNSDFGLDRELGPDQIYRKETSHPTPPPLQEEASSPSLQWSLYDDLYFDTVYDNSESQDLDPIPVSEVEVIDREQSFAERRIWRSMRSHLASGIWNLSREQGNKLLASRFREDCLYICDWPGCVHMEEKRNYMLFRGVFKNFKQSRVWRTVNEAKRSRVEINCAFCSCKEVWDLHSAFCLRRVFGYHDDGEPVVRAYVCENGHVSGAWTDLPLYT